MLKIHCISTPRNISTALMYSFAQRSDTSVFDEPFYGRYLRLSQKVHPANDDILASQPLSIEKVFETFRQRPHPVLYVKNMAHHMRYVPPQHFTGFRTVLLIRDPRRLIPSFAKVYKTATIEDIGLAEQLFFYKQLLAEGAEPIVLDSGELLKNPARVLTQLCELMGFEFDRAMLKWEAGSRPEDGVWAPYWYSSVHRSTGFGQPPDSLPECPPHLEDLLEQSIPIYNTLLEQSIKA